MAVFLIGIIIAICTFLYMIGIYLFRFALDRDFSKGMDFQVDHKAIYTKTIQQLEPSFKNLFLQHSTVLKHASFDGMELTGTLYKNNSNIYSICIHGFTGCQEEMIEPAIYFYQLGFNVFCPDLRAHGKSQGRYRTMGYYDSLDVHSWIHQIKQSNPEAKFILFGWSMGASTILMMNQNLSQDVLGCICDCGYGSAWDEFSYQLKEMFHLPAFPFLYIASWYCHKKLGFTFKNINCKKAISQSKVPMLFIHGDQDTFVPFKFLDELYNAKPEPKEKLVIHKAGHCQSMFKNKSTYWNTVHAFIQKII